MTERKQALTDLMNAWFEHTATEESFDGKIVEIDGKKYKMTEV